jgi:succinate dehydrogenase / fumarate reductase, membrane anchor subunit
MGGTVTVPKKPGHSGVGHFKIERLTSVLLIPLTLWALYAAAKVAPGGFDAVVAFVREPVNAALVLLLATISAAHMRLGMTVIIEDYVETPALRGLVLLVNFLVVAAAWLIIAYSIAAAYLPGLPH